MTPPPPPQIYRSTHTHPMQRVDVLQEVRHDWRQADGRVAVVDAHAHQLGQGALGAGLQGRGA